MVDKSKHVLLSRRGPESKESTRYLPYYGYSVLATILVYSNTIFRDSCLGLCIIHELFVIVDTNSTGGGSKDVSSHVYDSLPHTSLYTTRLTPGLENVRPSSRFLLL